MTGSICVKSSRFDHLERLLEAQVARPLKVNSVGVSGFERTPNFTSIYNDETKSLLTTHCLESLQNTDVRNDYVNLRRYIIIIGTLGTSRNDQKVKCEYYTRLVSKLLQLRCHNMTNYAETKNCFWRIALQGTYSCMGIF